MRATVARELGVIGESRVPTAAGLVHAAALAVFVIAWGDGIGVPLLADRPFYEHARLMQWGLLVLLLPWAAARCMAVEPMQDTRALLARAAAIALALIVVVAAAWPVVLIAAQISALPVARVINDEGAVLLLAAVAAGIALAWRQICGNRLLGWMGATLSTIAIVFLMRTV
jgi:hypothetical protein